MNVRLARIIGINFFEFIKLNYFSKNIIRDKGKYIIPQWGSVIDISKSAQLVLHEYIKVNCPKYKQSKEEAYLILHDNSTLVINGSVHLASRATIEIGRNAKMTLDESFINHEASIIIEKEASIGKGCLISRGVRILDSDFHKILDEDGNQINNPKSLEIGNHVWIGIGAIILRGCNIGDGAVISAGAVVMGKVKQGTNATGNPARSYSNIIWEE